MSGGYPFGDEMARYSDDFEIWLQPMVAKFHVKGHDQSALWQILEEMHDASSQLCKLEVVKISRN
jgi:glutathione peroxidase-family protein